MESSAVEELATQLGVRSNELLTWLTGPGIESYITLQITRNALFSALWIFLCIASMRLATSFVKKLNGDTYADEALCTAGAAALACLAVTFLVCGAFNVISLIEWLVAPEGLIVETLIQLA